MRKKWGNGYGKKTGFIIALTLSAASVTAVIPTMETWAAESVVQNQDDQDAVRTTWKREAIQSPASGELAAAGEITVKWKSLTGLDSGTKEYRIYLDDVLQSTVTADDTTEVMNTKLYGTVTQKHTLKIEAVLEDGRVVTANLREFFTSKKGFGLAHELAASAPEDLANSWYYNWSPDADSRARADLDFVPMIWNASNLSRLSDGSLTEYETVLGYNEPDLQSQANTSAQDTASVQQQFTDSGLRVGSPAVSGMPKSDNTWFNEYMQLINSDDLDFITVHCYPGYTDGNADSFLADLDAIYELYHKPIWVTEFAIARWDGDFLWYNGTDEENNAKVREFMKNAIAGMESRSYVERYAWQTFDKGDWAGGSSCLMDQNTGVLTETGELYRSLGNPEGYVLPAKDGTVQMQNVSETEVEDTGFDEPAEPQAVTAITSMTLDGTTVRVTASRRLDEGLEIVEQGMLLSKKEIPEEDFVLQRSGLLQCKGKLMSLKGNLILNVRNVPSGKSIYARSYVIYRNLSTGEEKILYSPIQSIDS